MGTLGPPYCGISATIRIGQEMLCLPVAGFFQKVQQFQKAQRKAKQMLQSAQKFNNKKFQAWGLHSFGATTYIGQKCQSFTFPKDLFGFEHQI